MLCRKRLRHRSQQPVGKNAGIAHRLLGIPDLHGTGGDRVRETPGSALAAGMDRLALRTALQRIPDNDLDDRAARSVSVLSHFAGADDGHLCTGHVATALEYDEVLVGTMADSNCSCCGRAHCPAASLRSRQCPTMFGAGRVALERLAITSISMTSVVISVQKRTSLFQTHAEFF